MPAHVDFNQADLDFDKPATHSVTITFDVDKHAVSTQYALGIALRILSDHSDAPMTVVIERQSKAESKDVRWTLERKVPGGQVYEQLEVITPVKLLSPEEVSKQFTLFNLPG